MTCNHHLFPDQQIVQRALTEQEQRINDLKQEYEMVSKIVFFSQM
jgi:hypothetical protein